MKYPTSKQLQRMRDAFSDANGIEVFGPEDGGAWQGEREVGIGLRASQLETYRLIDDRRGLATLRASWAGVSDYEVLDVERQFGVPFTWKLGLDQWPELPQARWEADR